MIAVVTDSTCDIPQDWIERSGIHVIPALITFGQQTLPDGVGITREEFYERLPTMRPLPKTSAPSPAAFMEVYERLLQRASAIVSIHAASKLSGIYNAARLAARQVAPQRIHLVDSGQVSMGLGWAVLAAVDAIRRSANVEAVLNSVHDTLARVKLFAVFNTLEYLARSGRINLVQAGLGSLLNIKPMVELHDGVVSTVIRVRTWTRVVNALTDRLRQLAPFERLAVMHTNCADAAHDLLERVREVIPPRNEIVIANATTVIGTHVGPGALGFAAVTAKSAR